MGGGSHLLAAKHLNRRFLGCEINEHYFALAKKRLAGQFLLCFSSVSSGINHRKFNMVKWRIGIGRAEAQNHNLAPMENVNIATITKTILRIKIVFQKMVLLALSILKSMDDICHDTFPEHIGNPHDIPHALLHRWCSSCKAYPKQDQLFSFICESISQLLAGLQDTRFGTLFHYLQAHAIVG